MTRNRLTGIAGVLFGLIFLGTGMYAGATPDAEGSGGAERFVRHWSETDNQSKAVFAAMAISYAFLLLLGFAVGLRDRLRQVDSGPLPTLALAAGIVCSALLLAGGVTSTAMGVAADYSESFEVDGSTAMVLDHLGYGLFAPGFMAGAVLAVVTGIVTLRTRVLPVWTAWLGFLIGVGALGSYFTAWTSFFLLPIWAFVVGIVLLMERSPAASHAPAQESIPA